MIKNNESKVNVTAEDVTRDDSRGRNNTVIYNITYNMYSPLLLCLRDSPSPNGGINDFVCAGESFSVKPPLVRRNGYIEIPDHGWVKEDLVDLEEVGGR